MHIYIYIYVCVHVHVWFMRQDLHAAEIFSGVGSIVSAFRERGYRAQRCCRYMCVTFFLLWLVVGAAIEVGSVFIGVSNKYT